ncbi:MAG: cytochrome c [Candidatus Hydrogenedentes bacterium]|nr:cytochrome c [Candidatus Hydrogenedentota bacterium]
MRLRRAATRFRRIGSAVMAVASIALVSGCHQGMWNNSRIKPLERGTFFASGATAQPSVAGTIPFGEANASDYDILLTTGKINGVDSPVFPFEITKDVLKRGQERYNIYCAPCHSQTGDGRGMIVQREMKLAGNYHQDRLRQAPPGYFFDVITNGFGVMYSYASRITPKDRWAIVAYIRALQLSQNASLADVPKDELEKLLKPQPEAGANDSHGTAQGGHQQ